MTAANWLEIPVVILFMLAPFILGWAQGVAREQPAATLRANALPELRRSGRAGHATYTEMPPGAAQRILTDPANKITYVDMFPQ